MKISNNKFTTGKYDWIAKEVLNEWKIKQRIKKINMIKNKPQFHFEKDYWLCNNGIDAKINILPLDLDRNRKLKKIFDKINGVEHQYIKSNLDYFWDRFNK